MTRFEKAAIPLIRQKQAKDGSLIGEPYVEYVDGWTFYTFDELLCVPVKMGLYKNHGKLNTVTCLDTGVHVCTSHLRNDSRENTVYLFEKKYHDAYMRIRHESEYFERQCEEFKKVIEKCTV